MKLRCFLWVELTEVVKCCLFVCFCLIQISDLMNFFISNKPNCCCTLIWHIFPSIAKCQFPSPSKVQSSLFLFLFFFPLYSITFLFMANRECWKNFLVFSCVVNEPSWDVELCHLSVWSLQSIVLHHFVLSMCSLHWYFF